MEHIQWISWVFLDIRFLCRLFRSYNNVWPSRHYHNDRRGRWCCYGMLWGEQSWSVQLELWAEHHQGWIPPDWIGCKQICTEENELPGDPERLTQLARDNSCLENLWWFSKRNQVLISRIYQVRMKFKISRWRARDVHETNLNWILSPDIWTTGLNHSEPSWMNFAWSCWKLKTKISQASPMICSISQGHFW